MAGQPTPALRYAACTHHGKPFRPDRDAILIAGRLMQKAELVDGALPLDRMLAGCSMP